MANYINKTILSESYAHIDVVELTSAEKADFEMKIKLYQGPRAQRMLGLDIEPVVRTADGSLKVYLTVFGSLKDALGDYTDFREALTTLYNSSKMVADACNLESLYLAGANQRQLLRAEARTGVVKATREIFDMVNEFGSEPNRYSQKSLYSYTEGLAKKVAVLNKNLSEPRDRAMVWAEIAPLLAALPPLVRKVQLTPDESVEKEIVANIAAILQTVRDYQKAAQDELHLT